MDSTPQHKCMLCEEGCHSPPSDILPPSPRPCSRPPFSPFSMHPRNRACTDTLAMLKLTMQSTLEAVW